MAITYANLVTKIRNYTEVDSSVFTDDVVNGFIADAEERILRDVNTDADRKYATASMVASQKFLNFPTGALIIRAIQITNSGERIYLDKRDTTFIDEFNSTSATGVPKYYARFDNTNFIIAPTPDAAYVTEVHYYYRPTSLTSGSTSGTTWLSTNAPNTLLYGALVEAYTFMKGEQDVMAMYDKRFMESLARLKDYGEARENTDAYRRGLPDRPRT